MKNYLSLIASSTLFKNMSPFETEAILNCLKAEKREFRKDEYIFYMGDAIKKMGLVVSGSIHLTKEDYWGRKTIHAEIGPADIFAESFACTNHISPLNAYAAKNSTVLFLDIHKILSVCGNSCTFHNTLIHNFVSVLAEKNIKMSSKIENLTQKSTKDKLLAYLSEQSRLQKSPKFSIPFNRQELADYLSVDRSAMSLELGKLQRQGIIRFYKNTFEILNRDLTMQ